MCNKCYGCYEGWKGAKASVCCSIGTSISYITTYLEALRFPFLFYAYVLIILRLVRFLYHCFLSTTYVGQVMAQETGKEPDAELATRMGNLALLWYSTGMNSPRP